MEFFSVDKNVIEFVPNACDERYRGLLQILKFADLGTNYFFLFLISNKFLHPQLVTKNLFFLILVMSERAITK